MLVELKIDRFVKKVHDAHGFWFMIVLMGKNTTSTVKLDGDVIRSTVVGNLDKEATQALIQEVDSLSSDLRSRGEKVSILVDLTHAKKYDPSTMQLGKSFFKARNYSRIALFGASKENIQGVRYLLNTIGVVLRIRLFKSETKALRWLHREPTPPRVKARRLAIASLGILLVAVAWQQLIAPLFLRLSSRFSYEASVVSYDNFYNEKTAGYDGKTPSDTRFSYSVVGKTSDVLSIKNLFDVRTTDGKKIFSVERIYGIDRLTSKHVPCHGDKDRTGYLFAPKNLAKQDFTYWHINYDAPAHMKFEDEEDILGLKTYRYRADYHADQTKDLKYLPGVGASRGVNLDIGLQLWVEPVTGHLVKYQDNTTAYFYDLKTGERLHPWNQFTNSYDFDSVAAHVRIAEQEKQYQEFITVAVPVLLAVTVLVLLIWAGVLMQQDKAKVSTVFWPQVGASVAGVVALTVIFGWVTGNTLIIRLHPAFSAMHVLTAVSLLVFAAILWLLTRRDIGRRAQIIIGLLLGVVISFQLTYFVRVVFDIKTGVETVLLAMHLPSLTTISPITVICFLLLTIVIVLSLWLKSRVTALVSQGVLVIVLGLAMYAIGGYAFQLEALYNLAWFRAMALHTAALLVILALSILFLHPEWSLTKRMRGASKSILLSLVVLVALLVATGLAWQQALGSATYRAELRFQSETSALKSTVTQELNGYIKALQGARGLFSASEQVNRAEWKAYVDSLRLPQNYPGMQGLGFTQIVTPAQKAAFVAEMRRQGFSSFAITPEGNRDSYSAIIYLEPFNERNQRAFGYDMMTEAVRRAAMEQARDTGEASLSGKVTLVQDTEANKPGMLLYLPVYRNNSLLSTPEQRQAALIGYVYIPLRMSDFVRTTVGTQTHGLNIALYDTGDSESLSQANELYSGSRQYGPQNKEYIPKFSRLETTEIANRPLTFKFTSLPSYDPETQALPSFILLSGTVLSGLFALLVFLLSSSRSRALKVANMMTKDLRFERNLATTNERKLQAILSSIGDGVFVVDSSGVIILFNKAAEMISGFSEAEAFGHPYHDILKFYNEDTHARVDSFIRSALKGKRAEMARRTMLRRKDGNALSVADSAAPVINSRGEINGAVVVFRDISRERQLEKMKDEFLSIASHELRTPMGAVRANTAMMLEGDYGPVNKGLIEPLSDVHALSIRLVELVNDLLDAARVEAERMKFTLEELNAQKLFQSVVSNLTPLAKEKSIVLKLEGEGGIVQADAGKVNQLITNLIGNALKFTNKGRITLTSRVQGDMLEVAVTDTGIGIPEADYDKLFGKFSQIGSQEAGKPAGTGLGLYISRQIARKMGGDMWLESSTPGKGSTFMFSIPRAQTAIARKAKRTLQQEAQRHPDQK